MALSSRESGYAARMARDLAAGAGMAGADANARAGARVVAALVHAREGRAAAMVFGELRRGALDARGGTESGAVRAYANAVRVAAQEAAQRRAGSSDEPLVLAELSTLIAEGGAAGGREAEVAPVRLNDGLLASFAAVLPPDAMLAPVAAALSSAHARDQRAALAVAVAAARATPRGAAEARNLLARVVAAAAAERCAARAGVALALATELHKAGALDLTAWLVGLATEADDKAGEATPGDAAVSTSGSTMAGLCGDASAGALAGAAGRQLLATVLTASVPSTLDGDVLRAKFTAARALRSKGFAQMQDYADLVLTRLRDLNEPLHAAAPTDKGTGAKGAGGTVGGAAGTEYSANELAKARTYALSVVEEFDQTGQIPQSVVQSARFYKKDWWQKAVIPALLAVGADSEAGAAELTSLRSQSPETEADRIERAARCAEALASLRLLSAKHAATLRKRADARAEAATLGLGARRTSLDSGHAQPPARSAEGRQIAAILARVLDAARSAEADGNAAARGAVWPMIDDVADHVRAVHARSLAQVDGARASTNAMDDMAAQVVGWMVDAGARDGGEQLRAAVGGVASVLASAPRELRMGVRSELDTAVAAEQSDPARTRGLAVALVALGAWRSAATRRIGLYASQGSGGSAAAVPSTAVGATDIEAGAELMPVVRSKAAPALLVPPAPSGPAMVAGALQRLGLATPAEVARAVLLLAAYVTHAVTHFAFLAVEVEGAAEGGGEMEQPEGGATARPVPHAARDAAGMRNDAESPTKRRRTEAPNVHVVSAAHAPAIMRAQLHLLCGRARALALGACDPADADACTQAMRAGEAALSAAAEAGWPTLASCTQALVRTACAATAGVNANSRDRAAAALRRSAIAADPRGAAHWLVRCVAAAGSFEAVGPGLEVLLRALRERDAVRLAKGDDAWLSEVVLSAAEEGAPLPLASAAAELVLALPPAALVGGQPLMAEGATRVAHALTARGALVSEALAAHLAEAHAMCGGGDSGGQAAVAATAVTLIDALECDIGQLRQQSTVWAARAVRTLFSSGVDVEAAAAALLGGAPDSAAAVAAGEAAARALALACEGSLAATGGGALISPAAVLRRRASYRAGRVSGALQEAARMALEGEAPPLAQVTLCRSLACVLAGAVAEDASLLAADNSSLFAACEKALHALGVRAYLLAHAAFVKPGDSTAGGGNGAAQAAAQAAVATPATLTPPTAAIALRLLVAEGTERLRALAADAALTGRRGALAVLATAATEAVQRGGAQELRQEAVHARAAVLAIMRATI